jgi:UDP-glucose 4-epimerase
MNILVTGGLGFIGYNLIKELHKNSSNIIYSLDNNFTSSNLNKIESNTINYIYGNTKDISTLFKNIKVDYVFHLGEYSRITTSFEDIDYVYEFNSVGTYNVAKFCKDRKIKLIYAASSSKYGDEDNENLSPYAWYKAKNVELIKNFGRWFGMRYSISYFYNAYGEHQILRGKYSAVIGRFIGQYLDGKELTIIGDGLQKRDFTNVSDIVKGLLILMNDTNTDGKEYQFGTGRSYTILEIAKAFNHPYKFVEVKVGERLDGKLYDDKTTKEIGWYPEHDVIEYIKQFILNYKLNERTFD